VENFEFRKCGAGIIFDMLKIFCHVFLIVFPDIILLKPLDVSMLDDAIAKWKTHHFNSPIYSKYFMSRNST